MGGPVPERTDHLLSWYERTARLLPWQATRDPYLRLVSEIMLQQTQVKRVVPRYRRFIRRFPSIRHLAAASAAEVLSEWSGLGYNRRALNLHRAARVIVREGWPADMAGLESLPGVGNYTAAALASFAFSLDAAAVDTNVRRVLSRWYGRALEGKELADIAWSELPEGRSSDWNQALMDLGSICTTRAPRCGDCPVRPWCSGPVHLLPDRPQPPFQGSSRQARGAVVRSLVSHKRLDLAAIVDRSGVAEDRVRTALEALCQEGLVASEESGYRLAH